MLRGFPFFWLIAPGDRLVGKMGKRSRLIAEPPLLVRFRTVPRTPQEPARWVRTDSRSLLTRMAMAGSDYWSQRHVPKPPVQPNELPVDCLFQGYAAKRTTPTVPSRFRA